MEKKGTDSEIFGEDEPLKTPTKGRPRINRDLARRLFLAKFSPAQVAEKLGCNKETARRIRRELEENGELGETDRPETESIAQADFDQECRIATGMSFKDWLKTKTKKANYIFNFCRKVWENEEIWNRPSLVIAKDVNSQLGDQLCVKFLQVFGEDGKRIRGRKKLIRNLFRFLGRRDLCDRHLTMTAGRDPRSIRKVPEIELQGFPLKVVQCIDIIESKISWEAGLACRFKTVTKIRTGNRKKGTGIMGLKIGSGHDSYLIMNGPDDYRCEVLEKMNETWTIQRLPPILRADLWKLYQTKKAGDPLFDIDVRKVRKLWSQLTEDIIGISMIWHDTRSISITWEYVCDLPLEVAINVNVGWKDLNTPMRHYLQMRSLMTRDRKRDYREDIPDWFKEDIEQYTVEGRLPI